MAIRERSMLKKQQEAQKAAKERAPPHLAVTWGPTESDWQSQQAGGNSPTSGKKKRGEPEPSMIAMEVNALRQQMEGSHKRMQSSDQDSSSRLASKRSNSIPSY